MKNAITCEAILISAKVTSFTGREGEVISYWEGKFLVEDKDGKAEYLALRAKEDKKLPDISFKDIYDGNFEYGKLTYAWTYSKYSDKHVPKFVSFE